MPKEAEEKSILTLDGVDACTLDIGSKHDYRAVLSVLIPCLIHIRH